MLSVEGKPLIEEGARPRHVLFVVMNFHDSKSILIAHLLICMLETALSCY